MDVRPVSRHTAEYFAAHPDVVEGRPCLYLDEAVAVWTGECIRLVTPWGHLDVHLVDEEGDDDEFDGYQTDVYLPQTAASSWAIRQLIDVERDLIRAFATSGQGRRTQSPHADLVAAELLWAHQRGGGGA